MSTRFVSERDFVANYLLPKVKEASRLVGISDVIDFHVEPSINGTPDLTAERAGKRLFLIEAKFKKKVGRIERDIEPRDPSVIDQAANYAVQGGFHYYATCNLKRIILFQLKPGIKSYESEVASFEYQQSPNWAQDLLKTVLELIPVQLKLLDDTLVDILHEAFNDLYPEFLASLKMELKKKQFKKKYNEWLESQGIEPADKSNLLIAEQTTYLQINKLLFYQVIRTIYSDKLEPLKIDEDEDVSEALQRFYSAARAIDYAPIYESDIISDIPFTKRAEERIRTLLDTLNQFNFSSMESDFLGRIYEKLISPEERKRLGQYYTPPSIVNLIVELTINKKDSIVLDPGCGSGTFLVKAYHKLRELNDIPRTIKGSLSDRFHRQLLDQIYGIDINQFPAHLSVINLSIQNPRSRIDSLNIVVKDFFDIKRGQTTFTGFESITADGKSTFITLPPSFDVIVANPPYIRQEGLGEKEKKKIKRLIEREYKNKLFIGSQPKKKKNAIILDKKSDIYIYFYIHSLTFLKNQGILGFISSNKWLEVQYGEPFQRFLLDNCKIRYIIEFEKAVFPDAEVNSQVAVLEKAVGEKNRTIRNENFVKFVHINRAMENDDLLNRIKAEYNVDDDYLRISSIKQGDLEPGKWSIYLRAPAIYHDLVKNPKLKPFEKVAPIFYGLKTGYDPYFILNEQKIKEWHIEKKFLKPCAPPGKEIKGFVIEPKHIHQFFLIVHQKMNELEGTNVFEYIKFGQKLDAAPSKRRKEPVNLPKVETIKGRELWYELPHLPIPSIIFPMWFRYKYRPFVNNADAYATDFYYYIVTTEENKEVLAALLCSTITQLFLELHGRQYSGMLHTKVYELRQLPMPDPEEIPKPKKEELKHLFWKLNDVAIKIDNSKEELAKFKGKSIIQQGLFEKEAREKLNRLRKEEVKVRSQLDDIIYDLLELSNNDSIKISNALKRLREQRRLKTRGLRVKENR